MKKIITGILIICITFSLISCNNKNETREEDNRDINAFEYTSANIGAVDSLGRTVIHGDERIEDKYTGIFYSLWLGATEDRDTNKIYDIVDLLENNPDSLWNVKGDLYSPINKFHYSGQPLYGYYASEDPWIITRHIEMFSAAGIDYLLFDATNGFTYFNVVDEILKILSVYKEQGFKVPKLAFYTNSHTANTMRAIYNKYYKNNLYVEHWFSLKGDNGKPLIVGNSNDKEFSTEELALYREVFDFKESVWPSEGTPDLKNGLPWMDWNYPQKIYRNGSISVSLYQHGGSAASQQELSNWGRGYDFSLMKNNSDKVKEGSNFQSQWNTVFNNINSVSNVLVTGWNEWIAIKQNASGKVLFCDTFNEEYSRDVEFNNNPSGTLDNYYMQLISNIKRYSYTAPKQYAFKLNTIDIAKDDLSDWAKVTANYKDFSGDAMVRNFRNADFTDNYTDNSNRNDITDVSITHDSTNLYVLVKTKDAITSYVENDLSWMNVLLRTSDKDKSFEGYNYVINRKPNANITSIERSKGGYDWESAGTANYKVVGNVMQISIPLSSLGLSKDNCSVLLKVTDNITKPEDIMNYYVSGDSAPIGRLGYVYGY